MGQTWTVTKPRPGGGDVWRDVAEIADQFGVPMYRVAIAVVRDPAMAEDVVQDALLKVWDGLDQFRGDAPLRAWVLRITHNTAVSTLRRIRDEAWNPHLLPEQSRSARIEETIVARSELELLEQALGGLDELSRSILALREVQDMSYDEIAQTLDITVGQVKIRLYRARNKLKEHVTGTDTYADV